MVFRQDYLLTDEDYNPTWAAAQWKSYGENIAERERDLAPGTKVEIWHGVPRLEIGELVNQSFLNGDING